ncbi:SMI1/KNR4 family protein [Pseudomonas sp. P7759]|uniref:SMI1/KNR4 family protein n=1 Tax=Pseudomonas sp. P7759 TaxID=2738831 RepID=UPI0015A2B4F7|nr:SMI1/KNR4 family protein [Pseudomonas sp. P7759]NWC73663.1 SMI1/KNR4 family protein [Pseudomonas sp. P7759]
MENFEALMRKKKDEHFLDGLVVVEEAVLRAIQAAFQDVPEDYLAFLRTFGTGEIDDAGIMLYGGFLEADEIFDAGTAIALRDIRFFGDDMQGRCFGFDVSDNWAVVEVDSSDMSVRKLCDKFSYFLYGLLS